MESKHLELACSLRKIAELLEKEDYINNLQEEIKNKNLIIKKLIKVIVMSYNKHRGYLEIDSLGNEDDVISYINGTLSYFNENLHIDGYKIINDVVDKVYKRFVRE